MADLAKTSHTLHRDYTSSKLGMWLFLFTEILLFGGLFLLYAVYRSLHALEFHTAGKELSVTIGTVNTAILLTSSLTMAVSISYVQKGRKRAAVAFVAVTVLLGALFLLNKYFEWGGHIHHGLYPGSAALLSRSSGEVLFYGLYYVMTGLHGLHVLGGITVLAIMAGLIAKARINAEDYILLENAGLYWHLVDVIWIYLFPLFYLIV